LQAKNIDIRVLSLDTETTGLAPHASIRDAMDKMDEIMAHHAVEAARAAEGGEAPGKALDKANAPRG
jgi:hypothetical protein